MCSRTTIERDNSTSVEAEPALSEVEWVSAATRTRHACHHNCRGSRAGCGLDFADGFTLAKQRKRVSAFTLAELAVTVGVLVLLVFLATQVLKSAATVTTLGHKQMDADSQTRQLLDRMAIDFAQMVKRSDVDYYLKSSWFASGSPPGPAGVRTLQQLGNDKIAFYSTVPGYYPSTGSQSPVSLVAYQVNSNPTSPSYNKLERMGKGLVWNAVSCGSTPCTPVVFMPMALASAVPTLELPPPPATPTPSPTPAWLEVAGTGSWSDSEVVGPQVFRFEYYYLLKGQPAPPGAANPTPTPYSGIFSDTPWDTRICACPSPTPIATPTPTGTPIPNPTVTMLPRCSGRHARRRRGGGRYRGH
jgi:hypothetical protein